MNLKKYFIQSIIVLILFISVWSVTVCNFDKYLTSNYFIVIAPFLMTILLLFLPCTYIFPNLLNIIFNKEPISANKLFMSLIAGLLMALILSMPIFCILSLDAKREQKGRGTDLYVNNLINEIKKKNKIKVNLDVTFYDPNLRKHLKRYEYRKQLKEIAPKSNSLLVIVDKNTLNVEILNIFNLDNNYEKLRQVISQTIQKEEVPDYIKKDGCSFYVTLDNIKPSR